MDMPCLWVLLGNSQPETVWYTVRVIQKDSYNYICYGQWCGNDQFGGRIWPSNLMLLKYTGRVPVKLNVIFQTGSWNKKKTPCLDLYAGVIHSLAIYISKFVYFPFTLMVHTELSNVIPTSFTTEVSVIPPTRVMKGQTSVACPSDTEVD